MVPVLVPTDDARARQGYYCSIQRLNRYCCAVGRRASSNRIAFVLKHFWPSCAVRPDFGPGLFVFFLHAVSRLIRMPPHALGRSEPRHALVLWIGPTRRTSTANGRQALLIC